MPNNGLIEWGREEKDANEGEISITFPQPFNFKPIVILAEENDMSRSAQYRGCNIIKNGTLTSTKMTIWYCDGTTYIDWVAIGH